MIERTLLGLALVLGITATDAAAGTAGATFSVHVRLDSAGLCISESLSEESNALVSVTCSRGQFVSIAPAPNKPFLGTHGGAFRFRFDPESHARLSMAQPRPSIAAGTVTALRVYNADSDDATLEMLVSF